MQLDKRRIIAVAAALLILALLISIPFLILGGTKEVELGNYVSVTYGDTYSGYASPKVTLNTELLDSLVDSPKMEEFVSTVLGIQKEAINDRGELFDRSDIPDFSDLFFVRFAEEYTNVKNGDTLIVQFKIRSEYADKVTFEKIEDLLDVSFDRTELQIRVNNLPEIQITKVDLSQMFFVDFGEYEGYATPSVTVRTEPFQTAINETLLEQWHDTKYSDLLKGSYKCYRWFDAEFTETYNNLSNEDTVTVRLIASEELTKAGITLEDIEKNLLLDFGTREHTFTVSGLETPQNVLDIFEGITDYISYSGVNEDGHIDSLVVPKDYTRIVDDLYFYWEKNGSTYTEGIGEVKLSEIRVIHNNKRLCTISFSFDKLNVCTGDVVTLTAKVDTQAFKDLGYVIPTTKIQITVPEIGKYLMDKSELTPQIIQDAKDFYANYSNADELHGIYLGKYLPGVEVKTNSTIFIRALIFEKGFFSSEYRFVDLDDVIIAPDGSIGGYSICDWGSYKTIDAALADVADQASHEPLE